MNFLFMPNVNSAFYAGRGVLMVIFLSLFACSSPQNPSQSDQVQRMAEDFFDTFAERKDWDKMCSFYAEDMVFHDVLLQLKLDSLWQFKRFYNWEDTVNHFEKLNPDQEHLVVEGLLVNDSMAVARGYFNPFRYNGHLIEHQWGMEFTIWLYFNEQLKIVKQVDWIEYDDYTLESTIGRFRKEGIEKPPKWLNLEK